MTNKLEGFLKASALNIPCCDSQIQNGGLKWVTLTKNYGGQVFAFGISESNFLLGEISTAVVIHITIVVSGMDRV